MPEEFGIYRSFRRGARQKGQV